MARYIELDALVAEIQKLDALYHTSKNISGELLIEELFQFLKNCEVKEVDLEGTEIIHESMLKALENYKVSSELFDVATEYIRNTLPRFNKKFLVKSNEISAAIFFGANWERQRIIDKVCWWLNNNRIGVIDDDYINKLRKELED